MKSRNDKIIDRKEIKEELRLIKGTDVEYITPTGNIYTDYGNDKFFHKSIFENKNNGYLYINLKSSEGKMISRRVHKLLAEAYLPNPDNLPIVMHKDNNKLNISLDNLKWGTIQENTQQAVDDKLLVNKRGYSDSQSKPVVILDLNKNELTKCGSISLASIESGVTKSGIIYQCEHKVKSKPRKFYFRYLDEYNNNGFVL